MKTLFKSSEIAHIWAHKSAPEGKSPGAMSFRGDSFYSYGTVIARHIERNGGSAIILNDTSYSNTTAKHQGKVRYAIPSGVPVFRISGISLGSYLDVTGEDLFEHAVEQSALCLKKDEKAKSRKGEYAGAASLWLEKAKQINVFFGLRRKVDEQTIRRLKESSARAEREAQRKEAARQEKLRLDQAEAFQSWLSGTGRLCDFNPRLFPVAFRIEGDELVSTLGARVPLDAARTALRFVLKHRAEGWHRNGSTCPVGHYQLDAVNAQGIVAGCHRITWEEVERVAGILGQVEVLP